MVGATGFTLSLKLSQNLFLRNDDSVNQSEKKMIKKWMDHRQRSITLGDFDFDEIKKCEMKKTPKVGKSILLRKLFHKLCKGHV